jgi:hypothetical protein
MSQLTRPRKVVLDLRQTPTVLLANAPYLVNLLFHVVGQLNSNSITLLPTDCFSAMSLTWFFRYRFCYTIIWLRLFNLVNRSSIPHSILVRD